MQPVADFDDTKRTCRAALRMQSERRAVSAGNQRRQVLAAATALAKDLGAAEREAAATLTLAASGS